MVMAILGVHMHQLEKRFSRIYFMATLGFICILLSALIPPLMSPDEVDHVKRAYWLSQGKVMLDTEAGASSGGDVDTGLMQYLNSYYLTYMKDRNHKITAQELTSATEVKWSKIDIYSPAPGTGFYFPAAYAPQAIALGFGRVVGLSVDTSYRLARLASLMVALCILFIAFSIFETNALVVALVVLPMTLFQLCSASLDGITNSLAILAISIFLRISRDRQATSDAMLNVLALILFILITSRAHLLPMLLLPFAAFGYTKRKRALILGVVVSVAAVVWMAVAVSNTVDMRIAAGMSSGANAKYYLIHPVELVATLYRTVTSPILISYYGVAFIGNLGWLDTPIYPTSFWRLCVLLLVAAFVTVSLRNLKDDVGARITLASISLLSTLLIFFAILVTYNVHPVDVIQGVQGRYFLVPTILMAYAIASEPVSRSNLREALSSLAVLLIFCYSTYSTLKLIVDKYYLLH